MSAAIDQNSLPAQKYIFNHDIMHCTADGVIGNELYSGRALGITEPWDCIQLHPDLKPLWNDITDHYNRIGLSYSSHVIWNLDLKHLGGHIGFQPSIFFYGPDECRNWGDIKWLESVEFINSKNSFMALAKELDIYVPKTECFDNVSKIKPDEISENDYPCYLKAAISVAGVGIYRCENQTQLMQAMGEFSDDVPVQIQEEIKTDKFLNLQYRIEGNDVIRLAASEQILDGFAHQGNRVPASHEPWSSVESMARWLRDQGMKGVFAFDVAVVQTEKGLRFPVIECNPRFNGATYPTLIAQKLAISQWSSMMFSTHYRNLKGLDIRDLEFNSQTGEGAIIVNWGTILHGKLMILLAGSAEYQQALANELESRF